MKLNSEINWIDKYKSLTDKQKLPFIFCGIVFIGVIIGFIVCMINTILGKPFFPYGTFVFSINRYYDFMALLSTLSLGNHIYDNIVWGGGYFPFFYLFLHPLLYISPIFGLLGSFLIFIFFLCYYVYKMVSINNIRILLILALLFSYPFLYLYDRGNSEIYMMILTILFILLYQKKFFLFSTIILSMLICMKLYPAVLIILFIAKKQFRLLLYTLIFTVVFSYVGYVYTGTNLDGFIKNLQYYNYYNQLFPLGLIFGHSLFNLIRIPLLFFTKVPDLTQYVQWISFIQPIYAILVCLSFCFISLYLVFINKKFWKSILILTLVMISFPFVSQDYTLIHLAISLLLLLNADYEHRHKLYVILLALLFIPMNWVTWAYPNMYPEITAIWCYPITIGLVLRPIIIIILLYLLMKDDFNYNNLRLGIKKYFNK